LNSLYREARDACIDNVRQYIQDAKKLMEIGSYGHACALLILGREELGKSFIYHNLATDESVDASILIESHTKKSLAHLNKLTQFSFLSALKEWMEKKNYAPIAEFVEIFLAREEDEGDTERSFEQHTYLLEKEKELNKLKMDALYVDTIGGSVLSPLDYKFNETASKLLTELEEILDFLVNVILKMKA